MRVREREREKGGRRWKEGKRERRGGEDEGTDYTKREEREFSPNSHLNCYRAAYSLHYL
jgi:hypothetical protein